MSRTRVQLQAEGGFGLIEVMVSAMLIVIIASATVASIGASQKQSARTLSRGIAANLAEQDQERMRAFRAADLANYANTATVTKENVAYTVKSQTQFVAGQDNKEVSCTSTGEQSRFLELTTTVTPNPRQAGFSDPPVTIKSLYALPIAQYAPTSGTLVVQIKNFDGSAGQPGIPVAISGPEARSPVNTNAAGCAIFQFLAPGAYDITVNTSGYVDTNLKQLVKLTANVNQGTIFPTTPFQYDRAGLIDVTVDANGSAQPFNPQVRGISVSNSKLNQPTHRETAFPRADGRLRFDGLFPFTEPYHLYSGTCTANDPSSYDTSYFTPRPQYGLQVVAPGDAYTTKLREPTVATQVQLKPASGPAAATDKAQVTLAQYDVGCADATTGKPPEYTAATNPDGSLAIDHFPFGNYLVCAEYTDSGSTWHSGYAKVANTAFGGVTVPPTDTLVDSSGSANGDCASGLDAAVLAARPPASTPTATPTPTVTP